MRGGLEGLSLYIYTTFRLKKRKLTPTDTHVGIFFPTARYYELQVRVYHISHTFMRGTAVYYARFF